MCWRGWFPLYFSLFSIFIPWPVFFFRSFVPDFPSHLHIDLSFLDQIAGSQRLHHIIRFTFWQAAVSTGLTLAFAFPCAFVMSHYEFKGKQFLTLSASIPFVLPAVVVAAALDASFGKNGWLGVLNIRHPLVLIFIAHVFYNFSVMLRILTSFWAGLRANVQEAAAMLGAGPFQTFIHITLPPSHARGMGGILSGVHLLLFKLWYYFNPWGTSLFHHRGRDLPPGRPYVQPAGGIFSLPDSNLLYPGAHGPLHRLFPKGGPLCAQRQSYQF